MHDQTLDSSEQVFDALGGLQSVMELTGAKYKTVHQWKASGSFPSRYYVVMTGALALRGRTADPSLWDMEVPAEASV